jgi:hypothetical protein
MGIHRARVKDRKDWVRPVKAVAQCKFDLFEICALSLNKRVYSHLD